MTAATPTRLRETLVNPTHGAMHPDEIDLADRLGAFMATRATCHRTGRMVVSVWITGQARADRAAQWLAEHGHRFAGPIVTTAYEEPRTILRLDLEPVADDMPDVVAELNRGRFTPQTVAMPAGLAVPGAIIRTVGGWARLEATRLAPDHAAVVVLTFEGDPKPRRLHCDETVAVVRELEDTAAARLEAGELRQCDGCGRLEDAGTYPDQDGVGRSACCADEREEVNA